MSGKIGQNKKEWWAPVKNKYLKRYIQVKKKYPSAKTEIDFAKFSQYALPRIVYVSVPAANIRSGASTMYRKLG